MKTFGVDITVLCVVGCPVKLAISITASLSSQAVSLRESTRLTEASYLNLVTPKARVDLFKMILHNETSFRYFCLLNSGVGDVATDANTDDDKNTHDPVANLGPVHARVVLPWQLAPGGLVR